MALKFVKDRKKHTNVALFIAILNPGNIMLTKSGTKLMDFGLAKSNVFVASASAPAASDSQS